MNDSEVAALNQLSREDCINTFLKCCGAVAWCEALCGRRPFHDFESVAKAAERAFDELGDDDWLQAFACHPKIGDLQSLRMKFAGNKDWSAGEQSGVNEASEATLRSLAKGNEQYESKFGYIFIVCATGKSAEEMLLLLQQRLPNSAAVELSIAAEEQRKITRLRLSKLELTEPE